MVYCPFSELATMTMTNGVSIATSDMEILLN